MKSFDFYTPTQIIFGKDTEGRTGEAVRRHGGTRVLIVYGGGSVVKSGLLERVEKSLEEAGIVYEEFGGAQPNPTLSHALEGVERGKAMQADFILAVGGGSSVDTAKGIAIGIANPDADFWPLWCGAAPIEKVLPLGVVLTIAAAGSEMSSAAVLTNEEVNLKKGVQLTDLIRPRFAVMNPELTATVPHYHMICGIVDIMMHTLGRYFVHDEYCRITDEIAEGVLRTVIDKAPAALQGGDNYEALAEIMWASSLSHNGITELGRGPRDFAEHALGAPLSARYDAIHGATLSAVWGAWAEYVYEEAPDRFARYARQVWGVEESDDLAASREGIAKTIDFFRSIEAPVNISELLDRTLSDEELDQITEDIVKPGATISRVKPLGPDQVREIFVAANR